jgi:hypothetical protein
MAQKFVGYITIALLQALFLAVKNRLPILLSFPMEMKLRKFMGRIYICPQNFPHVTKSL